MKREKQIKQKELILVDNPQKLFEEFCITLGCEYVYWDHVRRCKEKNQIPWDRFWFMLIATGLRWMDKQLRINK